MNIKLPDLTHAVYHLRTWAPYSADGHLVISCEKDIVYSAENAREAAYLVAVLNAVPELLEERDAAIARAEYFAGYEADLLAIRKALDEVDAPHDPEEGVSLEPRRIRLLGEELQKARAEATQRGVSSLSSVSPSSDWSAASKERLRLAEAALSRWTTREGEDTP